MDVMSLNSSILGCNLLEIQHDIMIFRSAYRSNQICLRNTQKNDHFLILLLNRESLKRVNIRKKGETNQITAFNSMKKRNKDKRKMNGWMKKKKSESKDNGISNTNWMKHRKMKKKHKIRFFFWFLLFFRLFLLF